MMSMLHSFALFLALAPASGVLSPEAADYNAKAMRFYDAGQLAPAVDEFYAAYQSMPDARRDLAGREQLVGSMRSTLLDLHDQTGEGRADMPPPEHPARTCRRADGRISKRPGQARDPQRRARHEEATQQLAAFGPDACKPPPPPIPAALPAPEPSVPAPSTPRAAAVHPPDDAIPPRQLKIAGGVTLGLTAVLLGVMTYGLATEASQRARIADINDKPADCPLTLAEYDDLQTSREHALAGRHIAIGTGVAAGLTAALGTTLLVLAHRSARTKRWSAAPWWSPTGGGLTLHVKLGTAR